MPTVRPKQAVGLSTKGIKELTAQLRALKDVAVSQEVAEMLGAEGNEFRKRALQKAREQRWPSEILANQGFVDKRWPQSRRGRANVSILFGFRKQGAHGYIEWGRHPKRGAYKVSPPRVFGMSLATLYEFGGERSVNRVRTWLPARPAYRPALAEYRLTARNNIKTGLAALISRHVKETTANG